MINYPEYAEVNGKRYKINTDFRNAIECDEIARNDTIDDEERALAIIFVLYGEEGLKATDDYLELLEIAKKFLSCNEDIKPSKDKPDMDYIQDMPYIEASFYSDYKINLENETMHWWKFYYLLNALSNSELGNCCIFNQIRNIRNMDASKIEDRKERDKLNELKERYALKRNKKKPTKEQQESASKFFDALGL